MRFQCLFGGGAQKLSAGGARIEAPKAISGSGGASWAPLAGSDPNAFLAYWRPTQHFW